MLITRSILSAFTTLSLLVAFSPAAAAACMDTCATRAAKCEKGHQGTHQKCVKRAEERKSRYMARFGKGKYAERLGKRAQKAFERRKATCDKRDAPNMRWCATLKKRCEHKCSKTMVKPAATAKPAAAKRAPKMLQKAKTAGRIHKAHKRAKAAKGKTGGKKGMMLKKPGKVVKSAKANPAAKGKLEASVSKKRKTPPSTRLKVPKK
ncbi:MAG: hypothetical protein JRH20_32485 [Deltaproteobacteria bacterium]|nr:hypothetical protein [Deltaproteobacteria bacterium]